MSQEKTENNLANALSQVAALRAEEPALAWVGDYQSQQSPKVLGLASQMQQEFAQANAPDLGRLTAAKSAMLNELARRIPLVTGEAQMTLQVIYIRLSAAKGSEIQDLLNEVTQALSAAREGEGQNAEAQETPQEKYYAILNETAKKMEEIFDRMQPAFDKGYGTKEDQERLEKEEKELKALKEKMKLATGDEWDKLAEEYAKKLAEHQKDIATVLDIQIAAALAKGDIQEADRLKDLQAENKALNKNLDEAASIIQANELGATNTSLLTNDKAQLARPADVVEDEEIKVPQVQNSLINSQAATR